MRKMKKRVIYGILCIIALFIVGCSSKEAQTKEEQESVKEESTEAEEEETSEMETDTKEEKILKLLGKYLDLAPYEENDGLVFDNRLSDIVEVMEVDGQAFKIGTSYADIAAMGYVATDPEFSDQETGALAYTCDFQNSTGKTVHLGFIGEEGQTVSEGELYGVYVSYVDGESKDTTFEVAGLNEDSDIEEIIDTLGEPFRIDGSAYNEYTDCELTYRCQDRDIELTFRVNLETEKIMTVSLEGYAE